MWTCANCREILEDQFEACWSCGCSREGRLNLQFMKDGDATDESSADKGIAKQFKCQRCGHQVALTERVSMLGTGLGRLLAKEFLAVSCENCGYTEFFNLSVLEGRTVLQNLLRKLFNV